VRDLCHDEIVEKGVGTEVAYDLIANELLRDGSARLNLATFVTTSIPPAAAALMGLPADKNMIDKDAYPQTAEIERRRVNVIDRVWHAPGTGHVTGTSTTGSSEAAMVRWRWRERMKAAGRPTDRPNLVTGTNVQVCWEKFCRNWEVEPRCDRTPRSAERGGAVRGRPERGRAGHRAADQLSPRGSWTGRPASL